MSKSISLTIQMNTPCNEDWNGMEPTEEGRFCNTCQKAVVNFADLTNQQILNYFLEHPFPVCGRIMKSQRDHHFANSTSKTNRNLSQVAAATTLLTLATITSEAAYPTPPLTAYPTQAQQPYNKQTSYVPADSVTISGTVKDNRNIPLENVEIIFGQYKTLSDENGNFRITFDAVFNKPGIIQFSHVNLERQVRSYHPLMAPASFDVTLFEPDYFPNYTAGIMIPSFYLPDSLSTFSFNSSNKLDAKTERLLGQVAQYIMDNPRFEITLRSYYKRTKQKAYKLSNSIKNFLVQEGIASEKIHIASPGLVKEIKSEVMIEFTNW
jgi:hypothetical protein